MNLGKDGTPFNKTRWMNWAMSKSPSRMAFPDGTPGRVSGTAQTMKRRGNIKRPCVCGRMNHINCNTCPCGARLR